MGTLFSVSRILIEILLSSCVTQETYHIETTLALIHIHEFYSGCFDFHEIQWKHKLGNKQE